MKVTVAPPVGNAPVPETVTVAVRPIMAPLIAVPERLNTADAALLEPTEKPVPEMEMGAADPDTT